MSTQNRSIILDVWIKKCKRRTNKIGELDGGTQKGENLVHFKNRMMEEVVGIWMKKLIVCGTICLVVSKGG